MKEEQGALYVACGKMKRGRVILPFRFEGSTWKTVEMKRDTELEYSGTMTRLVNNSLGFYHTVDSSAP